MERASLGRMNGDRSGIHDCTAGLLEHHPDADWALAQVALNLAWLLRPGGAIEAVAARDLGEFRPVALSDEAWLLLEAVLLDMRYASSSSAAKLDELTRVRPDWPYVHALLFGIKADLLRPDGELQQHLDHCAGDAVSLDRILRRFLTDGPASAAAARELLATGTPPPELAALSDALMLVDDVRQARVPAADLTSRWNTLVAAHGEWAWHAAAELTYAITMSYPDGVSSSFFRDRLEERPGCDAFRYRLAEIAYVRGEFVDAESTLAAVVNPTAMYWTLRLRLALPTASGAALSELRDAIGRDYLTTRQADELGAVWALLGDEQAWRRRSDSLLVENPAIMGASRIAKLTGADLDQAVVLHDSLCPGNRHLACLGQEAEGLRWMRAGIGGVSEIMALNDRVTQAEALRTLAGFASASGDTTLLRSVMMAALESETAAGALLRKLHSDAVTMNDEAVAQLLLARLDALDLPASALTAARLSAAYRFHGSAAAAGVLRNADFAAWQSPYELFQSYWIARTGNDDDACDRVVARLQQLWPDGVETRRLLADALLARREHDEATAILRTLAREVPGDMRVRSALLGIADASVSLADLPEPADRYGSAFAVFGDESTDHEELGARRLPKTVADSLQADVATLLLRTSVVLRGMDREITRHQRILQPLSLSGAAQARVHSVIFNANEGVPVVRRARVATPDGRLMETPRSEMIIRTPTGIHSGTITDLREMIVTLRGVETNAVVELVYETAGSSYLQGGWSRFHFFGDSHPVREEIFELSEPPGISARVFSRGVPGPETGTPPGVRRWRMMDPPILLGDDWGASYLDRAPGVGLTTFRDWNEAGAVYGRNMWPRAEATPEIRERARSLTAGLRSDRDRFAAIYRFVNREIEGLAVALGAGGIVPSPAAEVMARGWGDCKDSSVLLIALLDAVGIEARPVLVSTWGNLTTQEDLPGLNGFNHMIVQVTGVPGEPYCDPIGGGACPAPLPAASAGRPALHLNRDGTASLAMIPEAVAEDHGYELEVDLRPLDDRTLGYELVGRYRGSLADYMRSEIQYADTMRTRLFLDYSTGFGVPGEANLDKWSAVGGDCGELTVTMSYRDTTFAQPGTHSVSMHHLTEAAIYWGLPPAGPREHEVVFRSPYNAHVTLRLHASDLWLPDEKIAPFSCSDPFQEGGVRTRQRRIDGHRVLEVEQRYRLRERTIPAGSYEAFRRNMVAMLMRTAQVYSYRRVLDEAGLEQALAYSRANPDDQGFILMKSSEIIGTDLGGIGEDGERRRAIVREMMSPIIAADMGQPMLVLLAAMIETRDGRYRAADAMLDRAIARTGSDLWLIWLSATIKMELGDLDGHIERMRASTRMTGSVEVSSQLITRLMQRGDEDGVEQEKARLRMMGAGPDSVQLATMRLFALSAQSRGDELEHLLDAYAGQLDPAHERALRVDALMMQDRFDDAVAILEEQHGENPTDSATCNNLSWCYAITGRELDRALELVEAAVILSGDRSASRNTHGAVLMRLGRWKEARDIFREIYSRTDKPVDRLVNGYFIGLCDWELGDKPAAMRIWEEAEEAGGKADWDRRREWLDRLTRSREQAETGGNPLKAMFQNI